MARLIILRGLPGSGKTALAKAIAEDCDAIMVSADLWFELYNDGKFDPTKLGEAHAWCQSEAREALYQGYLTIVDNTNSSRDEVETFLRIAKEHDAPAHVLTVENWHGGKSVHNVPMHTIDNMYYRLLKSIKL